MRKYDATSNKTIEIQLKHHEYDISKIRSLPPEERINTVLKATKEINEWFRDHFVVRTFLDTALRVLTFVNGGTRR